MKLVIHTVSGEVETRTETLDGTEYLIVPAVAIVEGVLNGELAPAEEISKYVDAWNGIPLPVDHPRDTQGNPITANSPDVIEDQVVGRFYNAYFENDRLKGELWIDKEKAESIGGDSKTAVEKLQKNEPLELSTAYFRDVEKKPGTWNGKKYSGIQRNLRPDHLALLPNKTGACSWEDGCGAPRINCQECGGEGDCLRDNEENTQEELDHSVRQGWIRTQIARLASMVGLETNEDVGYREKRNKLSALLKEQTGKDVYVYIEDIFDEYVIYEQNSKDNTGYYQQDYTIDDEGEISLNGDPVQVERKIIYEPIQEEGDRSMAENKKQDKGTLVSALVANECVSFDKSELEGMDLKVLEKLHAHFADCKTGPNINQQGETDEGSEGGGSGNQAPPNTNSTEENNEGGGEDLSELKQFMGQVNELGGVDALKDLISNANTAKEQAQEQHKTLVDELASNENCVFEREELEPMSNHQLEKLKKQLGPVNYAGIGGPRGNEGDNEVPDAPSIVTHQDEKE